MASTPTITAGLLAAAVVARPSSGIAVAATTHAAADRAASRSCGEAMRWQPAPMALKPRITSLVTKPYGSSSVDRWFTTRRPLEVSL
jgi:hypothetical protein